ncbi:hypothetical protein Q4489_10195 [Thalassotalea sp. 1_MG-2023]|uniref:hypothetical protein n=1 Tax=Thalassotalea sp. 1_MG-2023 TaxID=3062680 RepID=UPI0026E12E3C|nr:hypothetical protein [Thalassotalea sp. 1_MG-2023]MDO6427386.1 hypothetical protein [Thalassotalea sp. 1_MG-2023]
MEKVSSKNKSLLKELQETKINPNTFIFFGLCIVIFILVQVFYFKVDMTSNRMEILISFSLFCVANGYLAAIKTNKRIDALIEKVK